MQIKKSQNRFKSWMLWSSVGSFTLFVLKTYFDIEVPQGDTLLNWILLILTYIGIINNPTVKNKI